MKSDFGDVDYGKYKKNLQRGMTYWQLIPLVTSTQLSYVKPGKYTGLVTTVGSSAIPVFPGPLSLAIPPWVGAISTGDGFG